MFLANAIRMMKIFGITECGRAACTSIQLDRTLNPRVAELRVAKTMMLSDLASSLKEAGKDIISLAAGEPDFDTPKPIIEAGMEAMR